MKIKLYFLAVTLGLLAHNSSSVIAKTLEEQFPQSIDTNFDGYNDTLCFANYDFLDETGYNPLLRVLGLVADKEGGCQGMVGVAAAVKLKVEFRPSKNKMSHRQVTTKLRQAVALHQNKCSGKVFIDGYENLRDLCKDHTTALKRRSLIYNLSLARKEILKYSWTFFNKNVLNTPKKQSDHIRKHLERFYAELKQGRYPLMMVRRHVTLVTGFTLIKNASGKITAIELEHYDPNAVYRSTAQLYKSRFRVNADQSLSGTLIWDVSPTPLTRLYCPFIKKDRR